VGGLGAEGDDFLEGLRQRTKVGECELNIPHNHFTISVPQPFHNHSSKRLSNRSTTSGNRSGNRSSNRSSNRSTFQQPSDVPATVPTTTPRSFHKIETRFKSA
jgi:hypothetical protein